MKQWFLELATFFYGYGYLKAFSVNALYGMVAGNLVWGAYLLYGYYLVRQVLDDYQKEVEISMMESEASFNQRSEQSACLDEEPDKKNE